MALKGLRRCRLWEGFAEHGRPNVHGVNVVGAHHRRPPPQKQETDGPAHSQSADHRFKSDRRTAMEVRTERCQSQERLGQAATVPF